MGNATCQIHAMNSSFSIDSGLVLDFRLLLDWKMTGVWKIIRLANRGQNNTECVWMCVCVCADHFIMSASKSWRWPLINPKSAGEDILDTLVSRSGDLVLVAISHLHIWAETAFTDHVIFFPLGRCRLTPSQYLHKELIGIGREALASLSMGAANTHSTLLINTQMHFPYKRGPV